MGRINPVLNSPPVAGYDVNWTIEHSAYNR